MAYTVLLNKLIKDSELTIKEIAERCTAEGVKVTPAYISTLRNDKNNRTPSDEMSRALAKACKAKNENILVVEAYLEKAPKEFNNLMQLLRNVMITSSMGFVENRVTSQQKKEAEEMFKQFPMSEFIVSLSNDVVKQSVVKNKGTMSYKVNTEINDMKITQTLSQAMGIPVSDDGMRPTINKENKVNFEWKEIKDYKTGDIVCFVEKDNKKGVMARQIFIDDKSYKTITMLPINSEYSFKKYKVEDITIFGKVTQVISDI